MTTLTTTSRGARHAVTQLIFNMRNLNNILYNRVILDENSTKLIFFYYICTKIRLSMTLQKWIEDRAIHGFPTFLLRMLGLLTCALQNRFFKMNFPDLVQTGLKDKIFNY